MVLVGRREATIEITYNVVALDLVDLAPSAHDPAVIVSNEGHNVNSLVLELLELLDIGRQMAGLAAGRECAGDGNKHNFLAFPLLVHLIRLRAAAARRVVVDNRDPTGRLVSVIGYPISRHCAKERHNLTRTGRQMGRCHLV
jgi:hypothetical protein